MIKCHTAIKTNEMQICSIACDEPHWTQYNAFESPKGVYVLKTMDMNCNACFWELLERTGKGDIH